MDKKAFGWLNEASRAFLSLDYLLKGEEPEQRLFDIAEAAGSRLGIPDFSGRFFANLAKGWYSLSSPIWSNFGRTRGLPISCFGSHISDSMESILGTAAEIGMMTKYGGGTSAYLGELRGRGSPIRDNGQSSGAVHFGGLFQSVTTLTSQGSTRRGHVALYLPIGHHDIKEFLGIRSEGHPLQDVSFGVCIPDAWMEEMIGGDPVKREIWAMVLEARSARGFPYLFFEGNANRGAPACYREQGYTIRHSQMCVTGDQRVVTASGMLTARHLHESGGKLRLFDNDKVVDSTPMHLIERDVPVFRITLSNGMTHDVTGYHKVKVRVNTDPVRHEDIACDDLCVGDFVAIQTHKGLFGTADMEDEAFLLGTYQANGTQSDDTVFIDVWEHSFDLIPEIEARFTRMAERYGFQSVFYERPAFCDCIAEGSPVAKKRLGSRGLKRWEFAKGAVPNFIWSATEATQWQYLRGLFYADGTIGFSSGYGEPIHLSYSSVERAFLCEIQLILANLGITASIGILHEAGQTCYRLTVSNKQDALEFERHTEFLSRKGVVVEDREYQDNTKKHHQVVSVEPIGRQDVYCCTVDSPEHHFVCNGIVTRNCTEIMLPNDELESFVCDLSSMNIRRYREWKDTDAVRLLVMFLDAVMSEFIEKAEGLPFMERAVRFARRHRAIGVGWFGWHGLLQSEGIPFESMEAKFLNVEIARYIKDQCQSASIELATLFGEPEVMRGRGIRNTTTQAIAPTKSSAFIIDQESESIEPELSNIVTKDLQKGKFTLRNRHLERVLQTHRRDDDNTWAAISSRGGSVQSLAFLSERERATFKTFSEISPREVIIQAAQRQIHIDQGQSLNLMISPTVSVRDVNALMIDAWKLGIKSLYYQKSVNAAQEFARNILTCSSCEA
jgi:ribonucleoside-diphosphate reductase alpha chain